MLAGGRECGELRNPHLSLLNLLMRDWVGTNHFWDLISLRITLWGFGISLFKPGVARGSGTDTLW